MVKRVVGRESELSRIDDFLEPAMSVGFGALRIVGEPGIGKTTLWEAGLEAGSSRGYLILAARAIEAEMTLAFCGLGDLLADVDHAVYGELPQPQRRALSIALLESEPDPDSPTMHGTYAAFTGVLRILSGVAPVLLAIDDLQWLDRPTLQSVIFASRRLDGFPVRTLTAARAGNRCPALHEEDVLRVGALSPAALFHVIKDATGRAVPRPTLLRIHRESEGNPFFALEIASALASADVLRPNEMWPLSEEEVHGLVRRRVRELPASLRSSLLRAAAASQPTFALANDDFESARQAGIVAVDARGRVRFAHPLYASAIYGQATDFERRRVHRDLACCDLPIEDRARHVALSVEGTDEAAATIVDEAAASARSRGALDVAAELAERAIRLTPDTHRSGRTERVLQAAEYYSHAGDIGRASQFLRPLIDSLDAGPQRSKAYRLLAESSYHDGRFGDGVAFFERSIDDADGDSSLIAPAEIGRAYLLFQSFGDFSAARDSAVRAERAAKRAHDDALLSVALATSAMSTFMVGGGVDEDRIERALAIEDFDSWFAVELRPSLISGWLFVESCQFHRARTILERLDRELEARGDESGRAFALTLLSRVESQIGHLDVAKSLSEEAFELAQQSGSTPVAAMARAQSTVVHARMGAVADAHQAAREALALAELSNWQLAAFFATTALAALDVSLENHNEAVAKLSYSTGLVEDNELPEPARAPFLPDMIEALVAVGDIDRAERLTATLETRGKAHGRTWAVATGARCRALVLAARGDTKTALAAIEQTTDMLLRLPLPLEAARTLIVRGSLERRRKQKRHARNSLEQAVNLCETIGASIWADRARGELARLGIRRDDDELTETERRIAELAAGGLTNREIAAVAFVSQKTVEANLSRVYRKLGIRSRAELGMRLAEPTARVDR